MRKYARACASAIAVLSALLSSAVLLLGQIASFKVEIELFVGVYDDKPLAYDMLAADCKKLLLEGCKHFCSVVYARRRASSSSLTAAKLSAGRRAAKRKLLMKKRICGERGAKLLEVDLTPRAKAERSREQIVA